VDAVSCPDAFREAQEALRLGKADMVFWGNYSEQDRDRVKVRLHTAHLRRRGVQPPLTEQKDLELNGNQEWFSAFADPSFPAIRDLIYFAAGAYRYDNREYEACIESLSHIPLSEDTAYIRVDRLMAHAYMALNKYERAARRYEHILSIQPGNAHAYLERGEMFAAIGKYEDAMTNFERAIYFEPAMTPAYRGRATLHMNTHNYEAAIMDVKEMIELDPDDQLAFGMLANLYALQDNKSLFFRYMEIALRKGFPAQEFLVSPACKKYRDSRGFQILIETYQR
jgi:tetratricopeptide (TPR) repeat protein